MDNATIKLYLLERLASVQDGALIRQIAAVLNKAFPEVMEGDEEYAAFQEELAKRNSGEIRFYSEEESIRMIREGFKE